MGSRIQGENTPAVDEPSRMLKARSYIYIREEVSLLESL